MQTLVRIGQQANLARTLETLAIDVCCIQETRIQDPRYILRLTSPITPNAKFHLRLSEASASGQAGVGIALSPRAEAALLDWIPVDSRLCAVRLEGACKVNRRHTDKRNLFVICAYAPKDCNPDAMKDCFYHNLHDLLLKASRTDIVILAGDLNARVGQLLPCEAHLGGPFGLDSCRSDNGDRLLALCSDHRLFLASTNFRRSNQRYATWHPPSSSQRWTQIDHIAISHKWRGCVKNCRSYWSTCVDSDHALVCARISMCFGGRPKRTTQLRLDINRLAQPSVLTAYQNALAHELETVTPRDVDEHWSLIHKAIRSSCFASCGLSNRVAKPWIFADSLHLLDARRSIPTGSEHNETRLRVKRALTASLRKDREIWWTERAWEMKNASASGNTR
ncbi:endonuclease/exonuclease/phosphatase family protein [Streptococcus dysgalactiae]|uniref:endonuclease/exonuclease/phosphatase family protein n=1 Tax=Streptococcus dysgalactiae TaxID=1334 RepID=UPI003D78EC97